MTEPAATDGDSAVGKGRPTPKRSEQRKRRRAATPRNRKEAAALRREKIREQRMSQRQALQTGDERHLPARDAGPARRLARDIVDRRFSLGQVFFVMMLVVLGISLFPWPAVVVAADLVMLTMFVVVVLDAVRIGRAARTAVTEKYGVKSSTGVALYAFTRSMQPRRWRRPPPRVSRHDPV